MGKLQWHLAPEHGHPCEWTWPHGLASAWGTTGSALPGSSRRTGTEEPRAWGEDPDAFCQKAAAAFEADPPPRNAWRALSLGLLPSILLGRHTTPTPMQGGETSLKAKLITTEIQADKSHCRGTWVKKADPGFTGQDRSHCTWVIGQRIKNPSWIIAEQRLCQLFARAMHSQCPLIPGQALQRGKSLFHWLDAESWKERRTSGHFYLFSGSF